MVHAHTVMTGSKNKHDYIVRRLLLFDQLASMAATRRILVPIAGLCCVQSIHNSSWNTLMISCLSVCLSVCLLPFLVTT